jgi:hypothetical protein
MQAFADGSGLRKKRNLPKLNCKFARVADRKQEDIFLSH